MKNQSCPVSFTKDHCILNKSQNPKFETGAEVGMENPTQKQDYFTQNTFILLIKPISFFLSLSQSKQSF